MDEILELLKKDARLTYKEIAKLSGKDEDTVKKQIKQYEDDGTIVQYKTVVNNEMARGNGSYVVALIEVSVHPQKDLGFDQIAEKIFSFPEVVSCYLVSGAFDLLVTVEGENIQTVSNFIASKLSPIENVRQTTTHFLLKKYKEDGQIFKKTSGRRRLNITY